MNRPIIAAVALAAGMALASPMLATAADSGPQAAPGQPGMMDMHEGVMGMRRGMMHHMAQISPRQRCEERLARRAGIVAYTVAKLNLAAEQRPLWDKVQNQLQSAADKQRQLCVSLQPTGSGEQTILDRLGRREQFLSARLQAVQQIRPALEQFYQALTPAQQAIVNHPFRPT